MTKVVIIAGGKGTRIASVNSEIPKAMIPVGGKPVIEYEVELARRYGYTDFIFIIGHLGNVIQEYFQDGGRWGVNIDYFIESVPLGTAGALSLLKEKLTDDFFVLYGDTVVDFDMHSMLAFHQAHSADATLFVHPNDHPYDSDIVVADADSRVTELSIKPHPAGFVSHNCVNAALFVMKPAILDVIPSGQKCHIEKDILPDALHRGMRLFAYKSFEYIKDMGTPERYESVCADVIKGKVSRLNRNNKRAAIFLDRDGVINREVNLLNRQEQMELLPGAAAAIKLINASDYLAIVVTNQPVIARNLCTLEELDLIHAKLETLLGAEGAYLNAIYFCPHHPDAGYPEERKEYKVKCNCRKPAPGMLLKAAEDWNIDLNKSYIIGDSDRDVEAGQAAGCFKSIKIETNAENALFEAVKHILDEGNNTGDGISL